MAFPLNRDSKHQLETHRSNEENKYLKDLVRILQEKVKDLESEVLKLKQNDIKITPDIPYKRFKKDQQHPEKNLHKTDNKSSKKDNDSPNSDNNASKTGKKQSTTGKNSLKTDITKTIKDKTLMILKDNLEYTLFNNLAHKSSIKDPPSEFDKFFTEINSLKNKKCPNPSCNSSNTLKVVKNCLNQFSFQISIKPQVSNTKKLYELLESEDRLPTKFSKIRSELNQKIERLRREYFNLKNKVRDSISAEFLNTVRGFDEFRRKLSILERSVNAKTEQIKKIYKQYEEAKTQVNTLELLHKKAIDDKEKEKSELQSKFESQEIALNHLTNQIEILNKNNLSHVAQISSNTTAVRSSEYQIQILESNLAKSNSEIFTLNQEKLLLEQQIRELSETKLKSEEEKNEVSKKIISDLEHHKNSLNFQLSETSRNLNTIEAALQDSNTQNSSLIHQISELNKELQVVKNESNHELTLNISNLTSKIQDLEREKKIELENLNLQIEAISKQNSDFICTLRQKDEKIQELEILLNSRPALDSDTEKMVQELHALNLSHAQMQNQIEVYRKNNSELSNILAKKDKELKAIQSLSEEKIKSLEIDNMQRKLEIEALTKSLENTDAMNEIKSIYNSNEEELRKQICELQLEIKKCRNEEAIGLNYEDYLKIMNELKKENQRLKEKLMLWSGFN